MRLYTLKLEKTNENVVAVEGADRQLYAVSDMGVSVNDMNELIAVWNDVKGQLADGIQNTDSMTPLNDAQILAPIPYPRQDVVCLGVNYADHLKETSDGIDFTKKADTVYFSKRVNEANYTGGSIPVYDFVEKLDYEVELGVILGRDAFKVTEETARDYIFGYTIINDVSAREVQVRHQQWYLGKSLDGYTPMGPCIVTADEITDAHNLDIASYVNGEKRQDSNTRYMLTTIESAITELSQGMTLQAGTIIATGTPAGVAMGMKEPVFLKKGDVVSCRIEQIGELSNNIG